MGQSENARAHGGPVMKHTVQPGPGLWGDPADPENRAGLTPRELLGGWRQPPLELAAMTRRSEIGGTTTQLLCGEHGPATVAAGRLRACREKGDATMSERVLTYENDFAEFVERMHSGERIAIDDEMFR